MARGRPRKIKPEVALDKAMNLFWEKGYDGTSMNDLVVATGMAKPGLYAAFGDKEQFYFKALAHYFEGGGQKVFADLKNSELPISEALSQFFDSVMNSSQLVQGPKGCMLINTLVECAHKHEVLDGLAQSINEKRTQAVAACFARARDKGEIATDADLTALTDFFSGQALAIGVMGRSRASAQSIQHLVDVAMSILPLSANLNG